jgi:hypothetical protein
MARAPSGECACKQISQTQGAPAAVESNVLSMQAQCGCTFPQLYAVELNCLYWLECPPDYQAMSGVEEAFIQLHRNGYEHACTLNVKTTREAQGHSEYLHFVMCGGPCP